MNRQGLNRASRLLSQAARRTNVANRRSLPVSMPAIIPTAPRCFTTSRDQRAARYGNQRVRGPFDDDDMEPEARPARRQRESKNPAQRQDEGEADAEEPWADDLDAEEAEAAAAEAEAAEAEGAETGQAAPGITVAEISTNEFHEIAEAYLERVQTMIEDIQDERTDLDVDYSSGVMTIDAVGLGVYVLNKQPPNKQIWLSSPISGPKRYDWCLTSETKGLGADANGEWIYVRDGSKLDDIFKNELGVDIYLY